MCVHVCVFSGSLLSALGTWLHKSNAEVDVPSQQLVGLSELWLGEPQSPYPAADIFSCFPGVVSHPGS